MDPSFIIGGVVAGFGAGWRWTDGEWLVLEADESDSTFLAPPRAGAIVTNVEPDHLDHHGSYEGLLSAFETFVAGTAGPTIVCADDAGAASLGTGAVERYGERPDHDWCIADVATAATGSTWSVAASGGRRFALSVPLPGRHLVLNATAAFALAVDIGADPAGAAAGIAAYRGVGRRFERRGSAGGVDFIDDYAHAPAEVVAVLGAVAALDPERVVAVFQPHRYSRTGDLWADYAEAFDGADVVVLTEIYAAGEAPVEGVSGQLVVDAVRRARPDADVRWMPTRAALVDGLDDLLRPGDLCLTMGAGDLTTLPDDLIARIGARP
jgi:UDP-N-acetylmuramate--alanine ligase